jgi:hypothetical protein
MHGLVARLFASITILHRRISLEPGPSVIRV